MLDTVHSFLRVERAGKVDLSALLPGLLSHVTEHDRGGNRYVTGYLDNLRVFANREGVSVKGSLSTYANGSPFGTLTRQGVEEGFERLSDSLHLPMQRAKIGRVDVAKSLLVTHSPNAYYPYLGECPRYKRLVQPQSLYYQSGQRTQHFYDKIAWSKTERLPLPDVWKGRNVLRYEVRFMRHLPKQFNQPEVTAALLYQERFYMGLLDCWVGEFERIRKERLVDFDLSTMRNTKDFDRQIYLLGLQSLGGEGAALDLIDRARQQGVFENRTQLKRLRDRIKEISQTPALTASSPLVEELERKIKTVQQAYR